MGVLSLTETLVVEEAGNQEVDAVGSEVGEAGEEAGITEGEVGEGVESNISLYSIGVVPSGIHLDRILFVPVRPVLWPLPYSSTCTERA
jgi:hypothetical protein